MFQNFCPINIHLFSYWSRVLGEASVRHFPKATYNCRMTHWRELNLKSKLVDESSSCGEGFGESQNAAWERSRWIRMGSDGWSSNLVWPRPTIKIDERTKKMKFGSEFGRDKFIKKSSKSPSFLIQKMTSIVWRSRFFLLAAKQKPKRPFLFRFWIQF